MTDKAVRGRLGSKSASFSNLRQQALVLVVLGGAVALYRGAHATPSLPAADVSRRPLPSLDSEQAQNPTSPPRDLAPIPSSSSGAVVPVDSAAPPVHLEPASWSEAEDSARRLAFYEDLFQREGRERTWSSITEETVRAAYPATEGVDAVLESVACRSTLCRVELSYPRPELRELHVQFISAQFPELPSGVYFYPSESRVVAYFARVHFELPPFTDSPDAPADATATSGKH